MQDAADGSGELKDGIESAAKGNQTITENLKKLSSSTLTFADGAENPYKRYSGIHRWCLSGK